VEERIDALLPSEEDSTRELNRLLAEMENREPLERLRKNFYHLWKALREAREDPTRLEEWRRAPVGSQEWRKAVFYEEAMRLLSR
jgi:hypothetical protein